jgi:hypothetical protein
MSHSLHGECRHGHVHGQKPGASANISSKADFWVDDSWGSCEWASWVGQISRVLPPGEFPIVDIPTTHPVMHTLPTSRRSKVPTSFWHGTGGQTSERGADSREVYFKSIQDSRKRLMVLMTQHRHLHVGAGDRRMNLRPFSPRGYAIGVNVVSRPHH